MKNFKKAVTISMLSGVILFSAATSQAQTRQETDNKVREMANETYVNRVKTSDKQQRAASGLASWYDIIVDFFGLD